MTSLLAKVAKGYFAASARLKTWKKIAALLRHNVPDLVALTRLRDRYSVRKHPMAKVLTSVIDAMNAGQSFDAAFQPWAPHEEIMLLRGGRRGNRLPEALMECVSIIKVRKKIVGSLLSAITYPIILLCMFLALLLTTSWFVMPQLALIADPETWDGPAVILFSVCDFVASGKGLVFLVVMALGLVAVLLSLPRWIGPLRVRADLIPPWSIYRLVVGSIWLFTMATLLKAHVQLDAILGDMLDSKVLRPWLRERVENINILYQKEANFGALLLELNMNFPDREMLEDLSVYASMPDFHDLLYEIATEWLDEGVERITAQAQLINTTLLIFVITLLCGLGIAIGSMQQQLTTTMGV